MVTVGALVVEPGELVVSTGLDETTSLAVVSTTFTVVSPEHVAYLLRFYQAKNY